MVLQNESWRTIFLRDLDFTVSQTEDQLSRICSACSNKVRARNRRAKVNELEEKLQNCTKKCDNDPSRQNVEDLECVQAEYDQLYDYITQGAIVRSRATWYEKGEKNNKYFLNLEKSNKNKSCLRKTLKSDGTIAVDPKTIMSELEFFYSNLYKENNSHSSSFLEDLKEVPTLTEELRMVCEEKIEYHECFNVFAPTGISPRRRNPEEAP